MPNEFLPLGAEHPPPPRIPGAMTLIPPRQHTAPLAGTLAMLAALLTVTLTHTLSPAALDAVPTPSAPTQLAAPNPGQALPSPTNAPALPGVPGGPGDLSDQPPTSASSAATSASISRPSAGTRTAVPA